MTFYRPTWVEISSSAYSHNIHTLKKFIGSRVRLQAVLKADAYGHGAVSLAPKALQSGASSIGVSSLEEAIQLRERGIRAPILILGGIYPLKNFDLALEHSLIPTVASFEAAQSFLEICKKRKAAASFHLKVDTGMGRIGVSIEEAKKILIWLKTEKKMDLAGVYSHLSCADSDQNFTLKQIKLFQSLKEFARGLGFSKTVFHLANSAGALRYKGSHHEMVRVGLASYGVSEKFGIKSVSLFPVLNWQSKIIFLKKVPSGTPISYGRTFVTKKTSQIATCPVGYADGVPRLVSNKGVVLVRGKKCPIVGRVTMDHIMVDVSGLSAEVGDQVTLIGSQGKSTVTADDWAKWAETIPYEIFCGISKRVPRVMVQ